MNAIADPPKVTALASTIDAGDRIFFDQCDPVLANWYFIVSISPTAQERIRMLLYRDGVRPFMATYDAGARVRVVRSAE